jgi:hypothetical protein
VMCRERREVDETVYDTVGFFGDSRSSKECNISGKGLKLMDYRKANEENSVSL